MLNPQRIQELTRQFDQVRQDFHRIKTEADRVRDNHTQQIQAVTDLCRNAQQRLDDIGTELARTLSESWQGQSQGAYAGGSMGAAGFSSSGQPDVNSIVRLVTQQVIQQLQGGGGGYQANLPFGGSNAGGQRPSV